MAYILPEPRYAYLVWRASCARFDICLACRCQQARASFAAADDFSWLGVDWGARGGPAARELALWAQLQREFRRRHLLPVEAIRRLEAVSFDWDPQVRRDRSRDFDQHNVYDQGGLMAGFNKLAQV